MLQCQVGENIIATFFGRKVHGLYQGEAVPIVSTILDKDFESSLPLTKIRSRYMTNRVTSHLQRPSIML